VALINAGGTLTAAGTVISLPHVGSQLTESWRVFLATALSVAARRLVAVCTPDKLC
jgi:hypothetical protein